MLNLDVHELFAKWMRDVHETRDAEGAAAGDRAELGRLGRVGHRAAVALGVRDDPAVALPVRRRPPRADRALRRDEAVRRPRVRRLRGRHRPRTRASATGSARRPAPPAATRRRTCASPRTAYLHAMLTSMRRSAELLGRSADAAHFAARAAVVKAAFNDAFLDARGRALPRHRRPRLPADPQRARARLRPHAGRGDGAARRRRHRRRRPRQGHEAEHRRARDEVPAAGPDRARPRRPRLRAGDPDRLPELGLHDRERRHHDVGALGARGPLARPLLPRHRRRLVLPARRRHPGVRADGLPRPDDRAGGDGRDGLGARHDADAVRPGEQRLAPQWPHADARSRRARRDAARRSTSPPPTATRCARAATGSTARRA